jgi:hypothetical protein
MASLQLDEPSLREAGNPRELTRRVSEAAMSKPDGQWLMGGYWDNDKWGGELPHRDWIDAETPNTPVAVVRYDLHMVLLNSLAMKMLDIDEGIADVPGGEIGRDANGRLTGIFKDAAKFMVLDRIPPPGPEVIDAANRKGMKLALSYGITQVHEAGIDWRTYDSMRRLHARKELPIRVYAMVPIGDWKKMAAIVAEEGFGDEWARWGACKALFDGSLGSRTALFYDPYLDDPSTRGIVVTEPAQLREWMTAADAAGLQIAAHAIGDRANDTVLDIMQQVASVNGPRDRRFRVEHAQHLRAETLTRFAKQDVIASVQPYHAIDDGRWAERRIGAERLEGTYAFHSLLENGAHVAFGSDWPVAPLNPLKGIEAAVLRQTLDGEHPGGWYPDQRIDVETALLAFTREAAFAGARNTTGRLAPGYSADFVVWDQDLTAIQAEKIPAAKVLRTVVGGLSVSH